MRFKEYLRKRLLESSLRIYDGSSIESPIIEVYVDYLKRVLKFNKPLKIRYKSKLRSNLYGYADLVQAQKGNYTIFLRDNLGISIQLKYIAHEFTHLKQIYKKELDFGDDSLIWKGKKYISYKEYRKLGRNDHASYNNLPWEREADENGKKLKERFIKSKEYREFKSKVTDKNLKMVIDLLD